ncbi:hypothetical protein [Aliarcobacter butzleri]|uniref:hypothetical protein n=1 Tax=Aliarcobacter butzleri TaxID=28197 RepID=UPI00126A6E05|nr:hypothetical protein [Aliarcobacter butzleri]
MRFAKGKTLLDIKKWKKRVKLTKQTNKRKKIALEQKKEVIKDFYTYEKAAALLNRTVSIIKRWINDNEHEIVLLGNNRLEKSRIDTLVIEF